jgi:hypothetical protein
MGMWKGKTNENVSESFKKIVLSFTKRKLAAVSVLKC